MPYVPSACVQTIDHSDIPDLSFTLEEVRTHQKYACSFGFEMLASLRFKPWDTQGQAHACKGSERCACLGKAIPILVEGWNACGNTGAV